MGATRVAKKTRKNGLNQVEANVKESHTKYEERDPGVYATKDGKAVKIGQKYLRPDIAK